MDNKYFELSKSLNEILYKFTKELDISQIKRILKWEIDSLETASYNHNAEAQYELALRYADTGYLVPNPFYNKKKYEKWLKIAVDNGNLEAMSNLANIYLWNEEEKKRRIIDGLKLLAIAYQNNVGNAIHNYKNSLRHLKNKKSDLRKLLLIELQNLPDSGKQFLKIHPDYAKVIERFYPIGKDEKK